MRLAKGQTFHIRWVILEFLWYYTNGQNVHLFSHVAFDLKRTKRDML